MLVYRLNIPVINRPVVPVSKKYCIIYPTKVLSQEVIKKMGDPKLYRCVYCLLDKPGEDFNKEHVSPQAFGTYKNNMTLHDKQVCIDCNSMFSKELETEIAEDSFESFLRITNAAKNFSERHEIRDTRIKVKGLTGVIKNLYFRVLASNTSIEKISFIPYPAIGIKVSENPLEYKYYKPKDFPRYSEEIIKLFSDKTKLILTWSIDKEEAMRLLSVKGYPSPKSYRETNIEEIYSGEMLDVEFSLTMDIILNRLVAKTAFNYLIYSEGYNYALLPKFDPIRNFIRYGTPHESIKVSHCNKRVSNFEKYGGTHIIGLSWGDKRGRSLYGVVSWFNESTHIICLTDDPTNIYRPLSVSVFDNGLRVINTIKGEFVLS
jgi:hypothetical protein